MLQKTKNQILVWSIGGGDIMAERWNKTLDFSAVYVQPVVSLIVLLSGSLMSFDYKGLRADYPKWPGLFDVLESNALFWTFIVSACVAVFDGLLLNLSRKLDAPRGAEFRISLYVHDSAHKRFIPCGRYSPNPTLSGRGRTSYPDNEGCISEGWKRGWHFDNGVPPAGNQRKTYNRQTYGLSEKTNASIRMQSCLYAVRRLDDALGSAVAVLVVEAIDGTQFEQDTLRDKLDGVADDFARMVHTLKGYIPNPAQAAESGL
jgi:hypothetical protein